MSYLLIATTTGNFTGRYSIYPMAEISEIFIQSHLRKKDEVTISFKNGRGTVEIAEGQRMLSADSLDEALLLAMKSS